MVIVHKLGRGAQHPCHSTLHCTAGGISLAQALGSVRHQTVTEGNQSVTDGSQTVTDCNQTVTDCSQTMTDGNQTVT